MSDSKANQANSLREVRPDDGSPSCHCCGSIMVPAEKGFKCVCCGATTEATGPAPSQNENASQCQELFHSPTATYQCEYSQGHSGEHFSHCSNSQFTQTWGGPAPSVVEGRPCKFRKKPVVIDAIQFDGTPSGAITVFDKFDIPGGKFQPDNDLRTGKLWIPTLEGGHVACRNDWIIRGIKGEFYPCKPDIFEATYEAAE